MKRLLIFLMILSTSQLFFQNCAKRGRPTGGAKDTIPPIVISMNPPDKNLNFNTNKIKLKFDEYVLFKDIANQLVVSPPLKTLPQLTPMGASKEFILTLNDTLKPNTTYTFDFGNSITDFNEGNKLERFKYVFSTGNFIDSLTLKGTVSDALERKTDKNIVVLLYDANESFQDSIIYRKKPNYIASTLDSTAFSLNNLKAGKYLLIALKEKNSNFIFNPKSDKIGFVPHLITLPTDSSFHIPLYKEYDAFKANQPTEFKQGQLIFGFEGNPEDMKVQLLTKTPEDFKSHIGFDKKKDTLYYWHSPIRSDSLSFEVSHQNYIKKYTVKIGKAKKDSLQIGSIGSGMLHLRDPFKLTSNIPLDKIDLSNIKLFEKDTITIPFTAHISEKKDEVIFDFEKKQFTGYKLRIQPKSIIDILGNSNKNILNYQFITGQTDNYGNLTINLNNAKPSIIVELLTEAGQLVEQVFLNNKQSVEFKVLPPAKYLIRFIDDKNNNKKWDTGNYLKKIQPENIIYYPKLIEVRANWDIIETFSLL
ncbi:MAG: Ig-like domain-containing protein [Flavobacteriaceae bacterium]|nr:Ig-like domain-containing protein [Flavobacteriaceae bacterium]